MGLIRRNFSGLFHAALILLWGWLSSEAFWNFGAEDFQSLGSLGVALAVLSFGLIRDEIGKLHLDILSTKVKLNRMILELLRTDVANNLKGGLEKLYSRCESMIEEQDALEKRLNKVSSFYFKLELGMLIVATLQWGYGDKFHCWVNNIGWGAC